MTARGVRVEMEGDAIVVNLFIMLRYGFAVAEVAEKVQTAVFFRVGGDDGLCRQGRERPCGRHHV